SGRVVGVDGSEKMVAEAQGRARDANLPVEFRVGDAEQLEFEEGTFEGCRGEGLFVHLSHPERARSGMVRGARPGARIVVADRDWETLAIDAPNRAITRKIVAFHCDSGGSRWIGRQLRRLFCEAGLRDVAVFSDTLVFTDYPQADFVFELRATTAQARAAG